MKVGVVGTGLAGLSAAWLLSQEHEVTVFEKSHVIGFDSHAVDIQLGGKEYRIDVPLRVFDEKYYKNLSAFYSKVGIKYEHGDYCQSYGYAGGEGTGSIYFRYYNYIVGSLSLPFVKGRNIFSITFFTIIIDVLRLYILAPFHLRDKDIADLSFGEYLCRYNYSSVFIESVLLPAVSAMCTCTYEHARNYPAFMLLTYFTQRALNGMRRVTGGSKEVIAKLSRNFSSVHCNTSIVSVFPSTIQKGKVVVLDDKGVEHTFDHVILATQANHASIILKKAPSRLIDILTSFEYVKGSTFVHTDDSVMPKSNEDWGNVHFGYTKNSAYPVASIWLNSVLSPLRSDGVTNVFQTVYPSQLPIAPLKILSTMHFERPVMNDKTVQALQALSEYQGEDNIWFCGAHTIYGLPLLENAVKSGVYVAKKLGCKIPWNETGIAFAPQAPPLPLFIILSVIVFVLSIPLGYWWLK